VIKRILALLYVVTSCAHAQEVIYFNESGRQTTKDSADYYKLKAEEGQMQQHLFYMNGQTYMYVKYSNVLPQNREGQSTMYSRDGRTRIVTNYRNNKKDGRETIYYKEKLECVRSFVNDELNDTLRSYYADGTFKRLEIWDHGKFVSGRMLTRTGQDTVYAPYEAAAQFVGGMPALMDFIRKNTVYPQEAKNKGIAGKVFLKFIIDAEGRISNVIVLRSPDPLLSQAALNVVKAMPAWEPARREGRPEKCYFNLPISFKF